MDVTQRTLRVVMQQDYFFVHYQVKLCVGRIKDILVDNFAKKGWVFFSGLMTGGMEKLLDIGKADRSESFKNDWHKCFIDWMSNNRAWMTFHFMDNWLRAYNAKQNNITAMLFYFWEVWCAMHVLDCAMYSLRGFYKTLWVYLSSRVRLLHVV